MGLGNGGRSTGLQTTIGEPVALSGIGVHSGAPVSMMLQPADVDTGIVFQVTDPRSGKEAEITADWRSVTATELATVLAAPNGVTLATVEHLMAALRGLSIDNVIVEIEGVEVPVMDGSAAAFVEAIDAVGPTIFAISPTSMTLDRSKNINNRSSSLATPLIYSELIPVTISGGASIVFDGSLKTSETESTTMPIIFPFISTTTIRVFLSYSFTSRLNLFLKSIIGITFPRRLITPST